MNYLRNFLKPVTLRPDQVNENNQVTDRAVLAVDRVRFGISGVLQVFGIGVLNTLIIRALGGDHFHLGLAGAFSGIGTMVEWIGAVVLRWTNSCRKAESYVVIGRITLMLLLSAVLTASFVPALRPFCLWGFLAVYFAMLVLSSIRSNIESTWIGDLVPKNVLGWFTGFKFFLVIIGAVLVTLLVGGVSDFAERYPKYNLFIYAGLSAVFSICFFIALAVIRSITDRQPKTLKFFAVRGKDAQLNYTSPALWAYITFFVLWTSGRGAMSSFTTAYMLDLNYSMTKIVLIMVLQNVVAALMVLLMGKISDRVGTRLPLMIVSALIAASMFLWVASAWFGIVPILIYQVLGGMAGNTHTMLSQNYGQEIFPTEGRAGYFGFARIFVGISLFSGSILAGIFMRHVHWEMELWGATLNSYHLLFSLCSLAPLCCVIPLLLVGKRTVEPRRV